MIYDRPTTNQLKDTCRQQNKAYQKTTYVCEAAQSQI